VEVAISTNTPNPTQIQQISLHRTPRREGGRKRRTSTHAERHITKPEVNCRECRNLHQTQTSYKHDLHRNQKIPVAPTFELKNRVGRTPRSECARYSQEELAASAFEPTSVAGRTPTQERAGDSQKEHVTSTSESAEIYREHRNIHQTQTSNKHDLHRNQKIPVAPASKLKNRVGRTPRSERAGDSQEEPANYRAKKEETQD
jgi:hypothetical protein